LPSDDNPHDIDPGAQQKHAQQLVLDQFGVFDDDYVHDTISAAVSMPEILPGYAHPVCQGRLILV
jgi:hypothetical protein